MLQTCTTQISHPSANQGSEEAGSRCSQRQKESTRLNSIKCAALCLDDPHLPCPSDPKSPCFRPHCLPHLKKDEKVTHTHTHTHTHTRARARASLFSAAGATLFRGRPTQNQQEIRNGPYISRDLPKEKKIA